jgi:hypothetical protein
MLGMVSNYNQDSHTLIGGEIGAYIGRLSEQSKRDLFVVRYNKHETFCICEWLSPLHDVFIDILNLGKSLANFNRDKAYELKMRLFRPLSAEETSRQIADAESSYLHTRQDWNDEEDERLQKCARGE